MVREESVGGRVRSVMGLGWGSSGLGRVVLVKEEEGREQGKGVFL